MVTLDFKTLTVPVGILRIWAVIFTCVTFSLVASQGHLWSSFWSWCMFSWCFCFSVTLIILVLEFTSLSSKLPISWDDFTTFTIFQYIIVLTASILYSAFYTSSSCGKDIAACVFSFLTFILYTVEVGLTRAKPGEISGFLSTVPGLLKVLEAFVACIIFICVDTAGLHKNVPGLQWCIAVYAICFIFSLLVIILTICRLLSRATIGKVLMVCNVLAVLMYITAAVIWPFYTFRNNPRPSYCPLRCPWNYSLVITFMTYFNLIAYIVDMVYSFRLFFFTTPT
ncbi:myeloid-associated differentiation marker homolog [Xiphophorus couchianus]|uniref:myeloid-associated differentiation marker homolog n=1 Tax=Xiphophorus couchianus TaxID=32473 RepID=UPI001016EB3F|nr:myeloid-associated differentiation marker homolog [Xiphophorus couchianus]